MAISKNDALTLFLGLSKGNHFWAQRSDGLVEFCQFIEFIPDDEETPTTGTVEFGVTILPIDADFQITNFNLEALDGDSSIYIDFVDDLDTIDYSPTTSTNLQSGDEISIRLFSQNSEPTLAEDNNLAMWIDTDDLNRVYLVYRRGTGDQVKVELV